MTLIYKQTINMREMTKHVVILTASLPQKTAIEKRVQMSPGHYYLSQPIWMNWFRIHPARGNTRGICILPATYIGKKMQITLETRSLP